MLLEDRSMADGRYTASSASELAVEHAPGGREPGRGATDFDLQEVGIRGGLAFFQGKACPTSLHSSCPLRSQCQCSFRDRSASESQSKGLEATWRHQNACLTPLIRTPYRLGVDHAESAIRTLGTLGVRREDA